MTSMSLEELRDKIKQFTNYITELQNKEYPNGWRLVSNPDEVIKEKCIAFSKRLSTDQQLTDLINKYKSLGFNTKNGHEGYYDKKKGKNDLFDFHEARPETELWQAITFGSMNTPVIYLITEKGNININCYSISASHHMHLMALDSRIKSSFPDLESLPKPNNEASISIEIPIESSEFTKYLL